jgi:hypothetical protein
MTEAAEQPVTDTHLARRFAAEVLAAHPGHNVVLLAETWTWKRPQTPGLKAMRAVSEWLLAEFEAFTARNPAATAAQVARWERHLAHGHVRGIALLAQGIIMPVIAREKRQPAREPGWHGSVRPVTSGLALLVIAPGERIAVRPVTDLDATGRPLHIRGKALFAIRQEGRNDDRKLVGYVDVIEQVRGQDSDIHTIPKITMAGLNWPGLWEPLRCGWEMYDTICDRDYVVEHERDGGYLVTACREIPGHHPGTPSW